MTEEERKQKIDNIIAGLVELGIIELVEPDQQSDE